MIINKGVIMMKEAILYDKLPNQQVQCHVCEHHCLIGEGKRGLCGVRENQQGILYALNYPICIASAIDPIEKKPLYHFLENSQTYSFATVGCNMQCPWCQNHDISQSPKPQNDIEGEEISPINHVYSALANDCPSISYTYSEPTIFLEYALDVMKLAHAKGLKNIWVSNGWMSLETLELIMPYLDAANIDYKGTEKVYQQLTLGHQSVIERNLKYLHSHGVHLEITTLIIPNINDQIDQFEAIASFIHNELDNSVPWHISRFFPSWKMLSSPITPLSTLKKAESIGKSMGLKNIYIGNVW